MYYHLVVLYQVCLNQRLWPKIAYNLQKPMKEAILSVSETVIISRALILVEARCGLLSSVVKLLHWSYNVYDLHLVTYEYSKHKNKRLLPLVSVM